MSRLQIAHCLFQSLLLELDHSIELERLLSDPRYARDVLLVCDAWPGSELPALAAMFRASAPAVGRHAGDSAGSGGFRPGSAGLPGTSLPSDSTSRSTSDGTSHSTPANPDLGAASPGRRLSWLPRWTQR